MNADHVSFTRPSRRPAPRPDPDPEALHARWHVMFSLHFGIRPWEWDLLTWDQVLAYAAACDQILKTKP